MAISIPTTNHHEIRHWADLHLFVPAEILEHSIDHNPAILQIVSADQIETHPELRILSWEEFFLKFDALGLAFVYDNNSSGFNEILQIEAKSPFRHPEYRVTSISN